MPTFNFYNNNTESEEQHFVSGSELNEFKEQNPHLTKLLSTPSFIGGISTDSGRLPDGFKDKMRLIKQKHPLAKGVDHLI